MPVNMLDLRDKQHPSCELPERIQRAWHLPYTNDRNREQCKAAGLALKARMEELMNDKSRGGLGDLPEKLKDCGLKRAFHDELGVRKVVFTFSDDMLTTVYKLDSTWVLFEKELNGIFKAAGVNPKHVIRCLLAELGPGVSIPVHHDTGFWATRSHRVHMPLITSSKVEFYTGKTEEELIRVPFPEFELVELNNRAKHMVKNTWDKPRVHLIFDFVEDHQVQLLKFRSLVETDVIQQTRRTIRIVKVSEEKSGEDAVEEKSEEVLIPLLEDDAARKKATLDLLARIKEAHSVDQSLANRLVREFCKLSKRYSDGEMEAMEYVAFLDRAFKNRDSAKDIVGLLHDRERAKALMNCLMKPAALPVDAPLNVERDEVKMFVIAGAMKSGTTSLYEYINEHPGCIRARQKEPHAFDWVWNQLCALQGETMREKYMKAFDVEKLKQITDRNIFTGEATPSYLLGGAELFKRLKAAAPNAKILIIMREPSERAWSHYRMTADMTNADTEQLKRRGTVDGKSFSELVDEDLKTIQDCKVSAADTIASEFEAAYLSGLPTGHGSHAYVGRGLYALQIELMLQVFAREQILFLKLEDLAKDMQGQMDRVFRFLDVAPFRLEALKKHNERGTVNAAKSAADETSLKRLKDFYRPHNARLQMLIPELDFHDWGV